MINLGTSSEIRRHLDVRLDEMLKTGMGYMFIDTFHLAPME